MGDENTTVQDYNELDSNLRTAMAIIMSFTEGIRDCVVFRTYFDRIAILLGGDELNDVTETGDLLADRIYSGLGSSMPIFIGIGKPVLHFEDISRSYNTATEVLEFRVFNGKHAISSYMDLDRKRGKSQLTLSGYAAAIHKEVKNGTLKALLQIIDEAFGELSDHTMPIENYYLHVQSLLTSIILSLDEQGIDYKDICRDAKNPILHLHSMKSLEEMKGWLKDLCRDILDYVVAEQEDYQAGQAKGAVAYIENHYADGDISLKKICKDLCMSVSYFSQIFKEETGTTFVDYLTGLRMEKAKDLLRNTSDKTYEIAAAVGYKDAHYFSLVFKKQVGMTATAFRDSITMTKI